MRREREIAIGKSLDLLAKGLNRPVAQVAASVGAGTVRVWREMLMAKGYAEVRRPWGAEYWKG